MEEIEYEVHGYAGLVPMASIQEQSSLNTDILMNGLKEPIILWNKKIVDGRCRQIACLFAKEKIRFKELDENLSDDAVKSLVKSLNTRRNLTSTQKIISACRQSLESTEKLSMTEIAESWGIGRSILANAKYIAKERPEFIEPLFNGKSVQIVNQEGTEVLSTKITAIYAYIKRIKEDAKLNDDYAWSEDTFITTQLGKETYYEYIKKAELDKTKTLYKMAVAELMNYKYNKGE